MGIFSDRQRLSGLTLYHYTTCPFCLRVRVALWRLGVKVASRNILIDSRAERELVAGGGRRQVPCLRIEDKTGAVSWLYESGDIVAHLRAVAAT